MKRSKFNELKLHFKICYAKRFIKPNHKLLSSPGEGFSGLPHEVDYAAPWFIARARIWQAGKAAQC